VRQPDSQLRVPAVYDGERPSDRAEDPGRAARDGWGHRPVHRGIPQTADDGRVGRGGSCRVTEDLNFVQRARREKLDQLVARGIDPFAYGFDRSHPAASAIAQLAEGAEEGPRVRVAGRLVAWRAHGKTAFAHLADESGRIQLYFRKDALGEDRWSALELLDIGDIVGVEGPLFRTRTGEVTVRCEAYELLAK